MKLAPAFEKRHWRAAAGLTVGMGPLIGMLYLGRPAAGSGSRRVKFPG